MKVFVAWACARAKRIISAQIRGGIDGTPSLRVQLYGGDGTLLDSAELGNFSPDWKKYTATCIKDTVRRRCLAIVMDGKAIVDLDMVSLSDTPGKSSRRFARRHGSGARRFASEVFSVSGGAVKGGVLERRYQWGNTISRWQTAICSSTAGTTNFSTVPRRTTFNRSASASSQIFSFSEDIGAEPLRC